MRWLALSVVVAWLVVAGGCATAMPAMAGGSTTPKHRTDFGIGGAARVPLGDLKDPSVEDPGDSGFREAADAGGIVPMGYGRYGLSRDWDIGLLVAGTTIRVDARHETVLRNGTTRSSFVVGIAPYGGWIGDRDGSGHGGRVGLEVPFTYGMDIGGVYELWVGARGSGEAVFGDFEVTGGTSRASGGGIRFGPVVGMALGVRRFHALVELTAAYEYWFIDQAGVSLNRGGFALIPAFALRLRL